MTKQKIFYCALSLLALAASCTSKKESITPPANDICGSTPASFSNDVHIIFQTSCTKNCHNSASGAGGVVLETYDQVISKIKRIQQRALVEKTMPPVGPLSTKDINTIQCWINSGVPNN